MDTLLTKTRLSVRISLYSLGLAILFGDLRVISVEESVEWGGAREDGVV